MKPWSGCGQTRDGMIDIGNGKFLSNKFQLLVAHHDDSERLLWHFCGWQYLHVLMIFIAPVHFHAFAALLG